MDRSKLVIGLPVYNGANYLAEAIESILAQTFTDWKLIISDNASTDETEDICRRYAQQDKRVIYHRQRRNLGAAPNYNYVFQPGNAEYYKWAAHDDILKPDYLRQCIELLDKNPDMAMAHCPIMEIDGKGNEIGVTTDSCDFRLNGATPQERFKKALWTYRNWDVFGVIRSDCMARTHLHGSYLDADRIFLAEVILQGNIGYFEEPLFCLRVHQQSYTQMMASTSNLGKQDWFKTDGKENIIQKLIRSLKSQNLENTFVKLTTVAIKVKEYVHAIIRLPMPLSQKVACLYILAEWMILRAIEGITKKDRYRQEMIAKYGLPQVEQPATA